MKTLNKIVIGVLMYWIAFVVVAWYAFFSVGSVPDTLIQYGLGGGSMELLATAGIEVAKHVFHREEKHDDGLEMVDLEEDGING